MYKRTLTAACLLLAGMQSDALAADINAIGFLTQDQFKQFSEELGAAASYHAVAPAEPLGITGFDIGLVVTATEIDNDSIWDTVTSGDGPSQLLLPKLHVHKGLPFNLDVGAFYSAAPDVDINLWGAELRYSFVEGSTVMPAIAVRGTYSALQGVDQLDLDTKGVELSISKGFTMLTPYAGAGLVWINSDPNVAGGPTKEDFQETKVYLGFNLNFGLMNLAVEGDRTGDIASYSAKVGWRF